jgi:pimeloyl-ACP methyl ester carboxylesterase
MMHRMRSSADVGGVRVHYEEAGSGDALVLLHAFPLSADLWAPQLAAPPAGWHVIALDFRGFGASTDTGARHVDTHADDVLKLLDHLGLDRVVLGGLSMGGYVAFAIAKRVSDRLRALVLVDTRAEADTPDGREARVRMQQTVREGGARAIAEAWVPRLLGPTTLEKRPDVVTRVRSIIEGTAPQAIDDALECLKTRPDATGLLSFLTVPALIVVGAEDGLTPVSMSEAMHRALPRSTLVVLPDAGHLASLEQPELFSRALADFLRGLPAGA